MAENRTFSQAFVREVKGKTRTKSGKEKTVHKAWKGVLKYSVPNPDYLERPKDGEDTRTPSQKRRQIWKQLANTFDPETVKTKSDALAELQKWKEDLERKDQEGSLPSATSSVGEYVSAFIDDLEASGNVERRTVCDYRKTAARIAEGFPKTTLRDLTPTMIQKWENDLTSGGLAPGTVLKYHRLLSEVCKHAVNIRELEWNPCAPVKTPKRGPYKPNSLTAEGYARLAATLDILEPSPVVIAATIAFHTGMRQGEVCGLRWRDYDTSAATITVNESIGNADGNTYSKAPKTRSSLRTIPVSTQLARALDRRRAAMRAELEEGGIDPDAKDTDFGALYIVGYVDGRYYSPTLIGRGWKALAEAIGLVGTQGKRITFHDLRHSFASVAIASGADVRAVAAVLGHANPSITLQTYADALPEAKKAVPERVSRLVGSYGVLEPHAITVEAEG